MNITYREAKRILAKQEEAREIINSYRGMETLGKRLQLKNNKELILKLFEIESDESIVEVFTHLKLCTKSSGEMRKQLHHRRFLVRWKRIYLIQKQQPLHLQQIFLWKTRLS